MRRAGTSLGKGKNGRKGKKQKKNLLNRDEPRDGYRSLKANFAPRPGCVTAQGKKELLRGERGRINIEKNLGKNTRVIFWIQTCGDVMGIRATCRATVRKHARSKNKQVAVMRLATAGERAFRRGRMIPFGSSPLRGIIHGEWGRRVLERMRDSHAYANHGRLSCLAGEKEGLRDRSAS